MNSDMTLQQLWGLFLFWSLSPFLLVIAAVAVRTIFLFLYRIVLEQADIKRQNDLTHNSRKAADEYLERGDRNE